MQPLSRWSARHPGIIVLFWVLAIAGVQVSAATVGSDFRTDMSLPGTDSQAALDLLEDRFPEAAGDADTIVVTATEGTVTDPATRAEVTDLLDEVARIDSVSAVRSPYAPTGALQVSDDATVAYATVQYRTPGAEVPREDLEQLVELVAEADGDGLQVAVGGQGVSALATPEVGAGELLGVAFAALVLFLVFRSAVAVVLPIVSALAGLAVATGVVRLASNVTTISDVAPTLGVLLGLGVGIDYALFILNRHRGNLRAGLRLQPSITRALDTSGRAVVFAGITVVIALLGLFLTGIDFLYGLAIGASLSVVFTVLASITLLPALLAVTGTRVLGPRERRALLAGERAAEHVGGPFRRWAGFVQRRPVVLVLLGLTALLVIASPAQDLRLGTADQGNDPAGTTTREAYDALAEGFGPGINGPLVLTVDLADNPVPAGGGQQAGPPPRVPQLDPLLAGLQDDPAVADVVGPVLSADGTAAVLRVVPTTSPQEEGTSDLIDRVRTDLVPEVEAASGVEVHVGGATATFDDFAAEVQETIPLFVSVVVGLSFLLLVLAFRSVLVPLVGALLNLVSAAAAFGVVVAVFQWGWAADLIGLGKAGPIEPFLPVVLFALLFGLSMDYQVFLVSRMHEEWVRTRDNGFAVRTGHADSGKVIVAAASIMVFVFGAFVFGDSRTIKLMGLGMAAAVLLDAFVIRMLIVPAVMHRVGPANWWLPRWLDRVLPHLTVEGADTLTPAVVEEPAETTPAGWDAGYTDGFEAGYRARYRAGYEAGYAEGLALEAEERYAAGYDAGFRAAVRADGGEEPRPDRGQHVDGGRRARVEEARVESGMHDANLGRSARE